MPKPASFILAFLCASPVAAQETLLPTDILEQREFTVTTELRYTVLEALLVDPLSVLDFKQTQLLADLRIGVGLGGGFEIEGSFPIAFRNRAKADEEDFLGDFEIESGGLGDLTVEGNHLLSPQLMGGLVLVLPTGDDDLPVAEIRFDGDVIQEGEKGGIGEGVFKAGFQVGLSHEADDGQIYYGRIRYVLALGTQEEDDFEIEHADVFTLTLGALLPLGENWDVDLRWNLAILGDEVAEADTGEEATEESHFSIDFESRFLVKVGRTSTLILGLGFGWIQDHEVAEEDDAELEDAWGWGLTLGLHVKWGEPKEY
jgi:hypothetical protein